MMRTNSAILCGVAAVLATLNQANAQPAPTPEPAVRLSLPQISALQNTDQPERADATEIAKKLQNPVGDLISVPFTNYTNFNVGPNKGTLDILQIQPVVPIHVSEKEYHHAHRRFDGLEPVVPARCEPAAVRADKLYRLPVAE
jgi:hypothetical protein